MPLRGPLRSRSHQSAAQTKRPKAATQAFFPPFRCRLAGVCQTVDISRVKSVAIIGASNDRNKFGNKAVRAFKQQGYEVFPVNPRETQVEGLRAYAGIQQVPVRPAMISVYLPPSLVLKVLPEIAAKGCDELWLNPGTESEEVLSEAQRLGINVIRACSIVGVGVSPSEL